MNEPIHNDPFALPLSQPLDGANHERAREEGNEKPSDSGSSITITDKAKEKLSTILADENSGSFLRVSVKGGGCSGYQVFFSVDNHRKENDILKEEDGARVVIDKIALSLVGHGIVDYQENLSGSFFHLIVPKSVANCGCGESFAL